MAEINFNNLYNQLNPMDRMFYDQQFKKSYNPNKENLRLSGQENYDQMKAVYDAQQQVPEQGFFSKVLDSLNPFSELSAAEPPQVPNLMYTNMNLPFDLRTGVTNTTAASPFLKSMADIDPKSGGSGDVNSDLVNQLIAENQKKTNPFNPRNIQSIFSTNFPSNIRQDVPLQNLGINTSYGVANEADQEQVKSLTEQEPSGIAKLFEFLQQFSPLRGLAALSNKLKQSSMYRPSTTGVFGYTPAQLNQMNALGGYYSEPERERRRRANRISNMLQRAAKGKSYSEKNLKNLMNQFGMDNVDTGGMIQSIKESSNMGYGRGDVGQRATPGRDYSSSPGAMAGDMEYGEE
jgi:hypothetical protein